MFRRKRGFSKLEKVAGCGKKRPPADLLWLFSQVAETHDDKSSGKTQETCSSNSLFQPLLASVTAPLLEHQTYRQWKSFMGQQKLSNFRRLRQRTIIIQPFTSPSLPGYTLHEVDTRVLEHLKQFCTAFFSGMTVELASAVDLPTLPNLASRVHPDTQRLQYLVGDINKYLKQRRPSYAQCVIGVATVDLYPSTDWNFVLGHASLTSGCGVFGFGRYFSSLFANSVPTVSQQLEQLWMLSRVLSHELCHTLGMKHCYYFHCAMNESSSIEEASAQPLFLCPVCLRKLKKVLRFDIFKRYNLLKDAVKNLLEASQPLKTRSPEIEPETSSADKPKIPEVSTYIGNVCNTETAASEKDKGEEVEISTTQHRSISTSLVQGSPPKISAHHQVVYLQQALQWLDRVTQAE